MRVVIDTNVLVAALGGRAESPSREVLRMCLNGVLEPAIGTTLFLEYEDVVAREKVRQLSRLNPTEVSELLDALLNVSVWSPIFYRWRPNLRDEADNHLFELAVAASAEAIVSRNLRDLRSGELSFPGIRLCTPAELIEEIDRWQP